MREETTLERHPERRWLRRQAVWVGLPVAILALGVLWVGSLNRQPRYQGKTSSQWFPYFWDLSKGPLPGASLTNGVPESFPVLWAVLQSERPKWIDRYDELLQAVRGNGKPSRVVAAIEVRSEAALALLGSAASPPFANLVVSHWGQFPASTRRELLMFLAYEYQRSPLSPEGVRNLEPVLFPLLEDSDTELQILAAASLLRALDLPLERLRRIAQLGVSIGSGTFPAGFFLPRLILYDGAGPEGRRAVAEVLAGGKEIHGERFTMPVFLLDPERHSMGEFWESTGELQRDLSRRQALGEWIDVLSGGRLESFAPWLEGYLLRDVESREHPEEALILNQRLDDGRFRLVSGLGGGLPENSRWGNALAKGLSASSPRVRLAVAMAMVRSRARSPEVEAAATAALLRRQDPEVMLRILTVAKVVPDEVAPLIHQLADGETPGGWPPVSSDVADDARALLAAVNSKK